MKRTAQIQLTDKTFFFKIAFREITISLKPFHSSLIVAFLQDKTWQLFPWSNNRENYEESPIQGRAGIKIKLRNENTNPKKPQQEQ